MLEIENIHTYYGDSHVLQGVSLGVDEGSLVTVVGRNGVGKTTLVHSIMGFTPPREGRINFCGRDITGAPIEMVARSGISIVPQGRRIFASLSVEENLKVAASIARYKKSKGTSHFDPDRIYQLFPNLKDRKKNRGNELSGGEQQMLAIGRGLISNPDLILMDEPTEGLAPILVDEITRTIAEIKKSGLAILLVEQSLDTAVALSDYIFVMDKGLIVYAATAEEFDCNEEIKSTYLGVGKNIA